MRVCELQPPAISSQDPIASQLQTQDSNPDSLDPEPSFYLLPYVSPLQQRRTTIVTITTAFSDEAVRYLFKLHKTDISRCSEHNVRPSSGTLSLPSATSNLFEEKRYIEVGQNFLTTYQMCKAKEEEGKRERKRACSSHSFHLVLKHSSHSCDGGRMRGGVGKRIT